MGKPDPRWRSEAYLEWVRSLFDPETGEPATEVHHGIDIGHLSGMGLTAPDWTAMPVTRETHERMHTDPELQARQWEFIARTLGQAIEERVLVLAEGFGE